MKFTTGTIRPRSTSGTVTVIRIHPRRRRRDVWTVVSPTPVTVSLSYPSIDTPYRTKRTWNQDVGFRRSHLNRRSLHNRSPVLYQENPDSRVLPWYNVNESRTFGHPEWYSRGRPSYGNTLQIVEGNNQSPGYSQFPERVSILTFSGTTLTPRELQRVNERNA